VIRYPFRDSFSGDIDEVSLLERTESSAASGVGSAFGYSIHLSQRSRKSWRIGELENRRMLESEAEPTVVLVSNTTTS
jgi:hypothetical protein